jgi:MFS transporter, DHA2 family, methylenomycin A resistance protein
MMRHALGSTTRAEALRLTAIQQSMPWSRQVQRLVLAATSVSYVVVILDTSIVNVALDRIASGLSIDVAGLQWVVNAYTLTFASLLLTGGTLGDRWGARRVYMCGLVLFTGASGWCAVAPTLSLLIFGRVLQGIGAALLVPCSLTLLTHAIADPVERARAIGLWASCGGAALAGGPLVGGFLVDGLGWRSIFLVNVPIGVIGIWLTASIAMSARVAGERRVDLAGQATATIALAALVAALIEGPSHGWWSPEIVGAGVISLVAILAFLAIETWSAQPMLPLALMRGRILSGMALVIVLTTLCFFGMIFVLSLYFQRVRGYSALETGLAFLPCTAVVPLGNLVFSRLAGRVGPRRMIVIGSLLQILGFGGFLVAGAQAPYYLLSIALLVLGLGGGLRTPASATLMMTLVEKRYSGVAAGVLNSSRQVGAAMGVAIFGALIASNTRFELGMDTALSASITLSLLAIVVTVSFVPSDPPATTKSPAKP